MSCNCPPKISLCVYQGGDFAQPFIVKDSAGDPVDLTGWTISVTARNIDDPEDTFDFTVTITDAVNGAFTISLAAVDTAEFDFETAEFDVRFEEPGGLVHYWLRGCIELKLPVTVS